MENTLIKSRFIVDDSVFTSIDMFYKQVNNVPESKWKPDQFNIINIV